MNMLETIINAKFVNTLTVLNTEGQDRRSNLYVNYFVIIKAQVI